MMDTSTEYLKMCDCPEIQQDGRKHVMGDLFWQPKIGELCIFVLPRERVQYGGETPWYEPILLSCTDRHEHTLDHHAVFLPRQDQLQEMLGSSLCTDSPVTAWLDKLWPFYKAHHHEACWMTWEQFWLCFVMRVLHKKCWDGKGWVNAAP
jgi:hypothetical protein